MPSTQGNIQRTQKTSNHCGANAKLLNADNKIATTETFQHRTQHHKEKQHQ